MLISMFCRIGRDGLVALEVKGVEVVGFAYLRRKRSGEVDTLWKD